MCSCHGYRGTQSTPPQQGDSLIGSRQQQMPTTSVSLLPVPSLLCPQAEAQELEMVKMSKFGAGLGAPSKEERLREAADIHIRLGNVQKYCELMVELGQVRLACQVHSVHFVHSVHCILCTVCTLCTVYTMYTRYNVHYVHYVHSVQCTICTFGTLYSVHYVQSLHCICCTLYKLFTLDYVHLVNYTCSTLGILCIHYTLCFLCTFSVVHFLHYT